MLRVKRENDELIFELIPPFNIQFFEELKASIIDFQNLGKTKFAYNFRVVEQLEIQEAHHFESLLPVYQDNGSKLRLVSTSKQIEQSLSGHLKYIQKDGPSGREIPQFFLECQLNTQTATLRLIGDFLVQESLDEFKTRSQHYLTIADALIFDCKDLKFISTLAVGGFVYLKIQADKLGKPILLCNVSGSIRSALKMASITKIIPLFDSESDCDRYLQKRVVQATQE